jgi:hypothetical protein
MNKQYQFKNTVWKSEGPGGWYFITIPSETSKSIRSLHQETEEGWGRLKANAQVGRTQWDTAIWFDTKHDAYILPLKAAIRKKEGITEGSYCKLKISIAIEYMV